MLRAKNIQIKRYHVRDGYYVEIEEEKDLYNIWLFRKDYCIKSYVFGEYKRYHKSIKDLLDMIEAVIEDYIDDYREEYEN